MYSLNFTREWDSALFEFTKSLKERLGNNLVMIIGLDENEKVYDSNVLVVVRSKTDDVIMSIADVALDVNSKYNCSINFHVCTEKDVEIIDAFSHSGKYDDCKKSFNEFKNRVLKISGVIDVQRTEGYDSNVLVVVRSKTDDVIMSIADVALDVNSKYNCSINFHVVQNG
jgi:Pyruvate/2-oxoacid:ferredoxin oxidoreductase delta subunit